MNQKGQGASDSRFPLLKVENLSIEFKTEEGLIEAVKDISFVIEKGDVLGLVGESGSGKSVSALSIMNLLPFPSGHISEGRILFEGTDLLKLPPRKMQKIRGRHISMIFQEPMTSLNPVFSIGEQISEVLRTHKKMNRKEAFERSLDLMDQVGISRPKERLHSYPHEMSGGQRQRVMIAMAVACHPQLLIADEPTTALDVTIQKQVINLLKKLQKIYNMGMLFISHDLGVIGEIANKVAVLYRGKIVENKSSRDIFAKASHPYTKGLIACRPSLYRDAKRLPTIRDFMDEEGREKPFSSRVQVKDSSPPHLSHGSSDPSLSSVILEVQNLNKSFPLKRNFLGHIKTWVHAVCDVSFSIKRGSTLGLVGESGCGKTTLGRIILRLVEPDSGKILYNQMDLLHLNNRDMRKLRRKIQIVFQDPYASLNPRMTIGSALIEPMKVHGIGENRKERFERAASLVERCGLQSSMLSRYPHEFSGGQRQRICIARALSLEPEFVICDESVSALDVSVQAQILNLLLSLQEERNLTYIFISHDLSVVKFISKEVAVMKEGRIVEQASSQSIYQTPQNAYTKKLIQSIPKEMTQQALEH